MNMNLQLKVNWHKIMEQYGYTCCDHDEDTITFIVDC